MKTKPMSERKIRGSKGQSVTRTADSLFSTDIVELLIGVSEGPIKGLEEGAKSWYIGNTPLMSADGTNNFDRFQLITLDGNPTGTDIKSRMGGFGSSTSVSTELDYAVPVIRSGVYSNIDYIDIRLVISRLLRESDKGTFNHTGTVKIEVSRSDTPSVWVPVSNALTSPPNISTAIADGVVYNSNGESTQQVVSAHDLLMGVKGTAPTNTAAIWINSSEDYVDYNWNGTNWIKNPSPTTTNPRQLANGRLLYVQATAPSAATAGYLWVNPATKLGYYHNGSVWVPTGTSMMSLGTGVTLNAGEISIYGKTTSQLVKEYRIPVDRTPDHTYNIRVTRTSAVNTTQSFFDVSWESFQEVTASGFNFPGLATAQLVARASEQFSSLPEMTGIWEGRTVKVPSNYDPTARTYQGVWDGLWKIGYTNNPAFVGYDLIDNTRYGLNAFYPITMNKWDIYNAGQWCDVITADGSPRFTFNGVISEPRDAREAINYIFGTFGARFFDDGNGNGIIRIDDNPTASMIFSPENVSGGIFTYSQTALSTRHNDITVSFINPNLNWQEDRRRIFDQEDINNFGRNATSMVGFGCTNIPEAIRRGRYKLITGLTEKTMVGFSTSRAGGYLQPYDIILIADEDHDFGIHGRVKAVSGSNRITLRDEVFLEAGINYSIGFNTVDVVGGEYTVMNVGLTPHQTGGVFELTTVSQLPAGVEADTVFAITQTGTTMTPKPFRVMDIDSVEDSDEVKITAVEVNRSKWSYIDGIVDTIDLGQQFSVGTSVVPEAVPSMSVEASSVLIGERVNHILMIRWLPSPSTFVSKYAVSVSRNGGEMTEIARVASLQYEWLTATGADYIFMIEPIGVNDLKGQRTYFTHQMLSEPDSTPIIEGLVANGDGTQNPDGTFIPSLRVAWSPITTKAISTYQVYWKELNSGTWQVINTTEPFISITNMNIPNTYVIRVRAVADSVVVAGFSEIISNAYGDTVAPPTPTNWVGTAGLETITLSGDPSTAADFKFFRIYAANSSSTNLTLIGEVGTTSFVYLPTLSGSFTRYKVSAVDTSANESALTDFINIITIGGALVPPSVPSGLTLTSSLTSDGRARLQATWNLVTDVSLGSYDINLKQGSGNFVAYGTTQNGYEWLAPPGTVISAQVRSISKLGASSAYSALVNHTVVRDTVAPNTVTGLVVTSGFSTLWLNWNESTATDLLAYEVYQSETNTTPAAGADPSYTVSANTMVITGLPDGALRYIWVRAVDTSGNKSGWGTVASGTTVKVKATNIDGRGFDILDTAGNPVFTSQGQISSGAYMSINGNNISLSSIALNSLVPSINFVGEFTSPPTSASLGSDWVQNSVYKNSTSGKSYILTGNPLAWLLYLEDGTSFNLVVESSNGTVFRIGQNQSTLLSARLFKNGAEVTEETPPSWFKWRRVSITPLAAPNDDATWNNLYSSGYKNVNITVDQVSARATFFCDIISS